MRGGSKGVPNKNLRKLIDKPLLAYTITQAIESNLFEYVVVSTDSEEIANESKNYGAESWFLRSKELATDTAAKVPVIRDALLRSELFFKCEFDNIIDLDATSPLRGIDDITNSYNQFINENADNLISACDSRKSPYFNLIEKDDNGIKLVKKNERKIVRRQDAPKTYDMNASIYIWKRNILLNYDNLFLKKTSLYTMPEERSIDIDTELDWKFVEFLLMEKIHND